jgi:single-strand DNA-binding protein
MASLNRVTLIGNLGRDVDFKHLPSGDGVANFSIATTESWKDKQGNKKEETTWHNIVMFGKLAEIAGEYLKKGSQVYLEGKIKIEEYEKDGVKKQSIKIICHEMKMLGGKPSEKNNDETHSTAPLSKANADPMDDDIPFARPACMDGLPFHNDGYPRY